MDDPNWRPPTRSEHIDAIVSMIKIWAKQDGFGLPAAKRILDRDSGVDDAMQAEAWKLSGFEEPTNE